MAKKKKDRAIKQPIIRKNDMVAVLSGANKGKRGKVLRVIPEKGQALVERVRFIHRHSKPSASIQRGGIIEKEGPIHLSNLLLIDPRTDRPTRVRLRKEGGRKVRVSVKSGEVIGR